MIKSLFVAASLLMVSSCMVNYPVNWYHHQGYNLRDCGPAVAAMGVSWSGRESSTAHARAYNRQGYNGMRWWNLSDIQDYIESRGVNVKELPHQMPNENQLGIYHVNGNHFVTLEKIGDDLYQVYDPLSFSINDKVSASEFTKRVSSRVFLRVSK